MYIIDCIKLDIIKLYLWICNIQCLLLHLSKVSKWSYCMKLCKPVDMQYSVFAAAPFKGF